MIQERQNQILSKNLEMSNRLRLKKNQTLMELPPMLKLLNMLTLVSSHFMPMKLTRLGFLSDDIKWKDREDLLKWARRRANKAGFTIVTQRSSLINPILRLVWKEWSSQSAEKKPKHASTGSRKHGCLFMVSGYLSRQTKEWGLNILNGVHNHAMKSALEGHILAGRLKEDDKKIVRDLTKSKMLPRSNLINLKNKRPHCMTNIK